MSYVTVKTFIPDDGVEESEDYDALPTEKMSKLCADNPDKEIGFQVFNDNCEYYYGNSEMDIYENDEGTLKHVGKFVFEFDEDYQSWD